MTILSGLPDKTHHSRDDLEGRTIRGGWVIPDDPQWVMLDHALALAALGYAVFPSKALTNIAHPMLGSGWQFTEDFPGTTDPDEVRRLFLRDSRANIAIQAGRNGVIIVDLDTHTPSVNGYASLAELEAEFGPVPQFDNVESTPSGGKHIFLRLPDGVQLRVRRGFRPGIDILAMGSLLVCAPSHRNRLFVDSDGESGEIPVPYRFVNGQPPAVDSLPEIPEWLLAELLRPRADRSGSADDDGQRRPDALPPTAEFLEKGFGFYRDDVVGRDDDAYRLCCRLWAKVDGDMRHYDTIAAMVYDIWQITPGHNTFPWKDALAKVDIARRFVTRKTRGVSE